MCVFLFEVHYEDCVTLIRRWIEKLKCGEKSYTPLKEIKFDTLKCSCALAKLECCMKILEDSGSGSLLKKYLSRSVFDKLKCRKTPIYGANLLHVIKSGVENPESKVGIYAPDVEAYSVFADLFDPVIEDYHEGFKPTDRHCQSDWGMGETPSHLDPTGEYVLSTRVRCGRSLEGYPFNPCLTREDYVEIELRVSSTVAKLKGELKGKYTSLGDMSDQLKRQLVEEHLLFRDGDKYLESALAFR